MMFRLLLLLCLGHCLPGADSQGKRKESQACVGCSVTLLCDGLKDIANQSVQWLFNGRHVGYITSGRWDGQNNFKSRTQLACIQNNNFSLVIYNVTKHDEGEYTCDVNNKEEKIVLFVGDRKQETPPGGDPVCRPDPPGSGTTDKSDPDKNHPETEDKQDSDENPPGPKRNPSPGVIVVIVLVVLVVVAVGAAVLIKLWRKQQTDENPTDCIQFFHACGKEGETKRGKNLPDPGPSEDALI